MPDSTASLRRISIPDHSTALRRISIGLWLALFLLLGLQVVIRISHSYIVSVICLDYQVVVLLLAGALLTIARNVPEATPSPPRILVGLWLALFLRWGFVDLFDFDYPISSWPWIGFFVYGLIIGVPLLVIACKPIADLGAIRLTVYAGFLMIFAYFLFGLLHDYSWFGMYTRLGVGMFGGPDGIDSIEAIGKWTEYSDWITPRLLTYVGLGYLLARGKSLVLGIFISVMIALADSILDWLVFLPGTGDFEAPSLSFVLEYEWPAVLQALLIQVSILTLIALVGAMLTLVRWPIVSVTIRRHRPVRRITPRNRLS